jgi:hypothetical protein
MPWSNNNGSGDMLLTIGYGSRNVAKLLLLRILKGVQIIKLAHDSKFLRQADGCLVSTHIVVKCAIFHPRGNYRRVEPHVGNYSADGKNVLMLKTLKHQYFLVNSLSCSLSRFDSEEIDHEREQQIHPNYCRRLTWHEEVLLQP